MSSFRIDFVVKNKKCYQAFFVFDREIYSK